jgi:hypothetical protein
MLVGGWYVGSNGNFVWEIMGWMDMLLKSVFLYSFVSLKMAGYIMIYLFSQGEAMIIMINND